MYVSRSGIGKIGIRENNIRAILELLYKNGVTARKDIARAINLTPSAVTLLVGDLIENDIIIECEPIDALGKVGRRKVGVDINYDFAKILSVYAEASSIFIAVTNLKGENIANSLLPIEETFSGVEFKNLIETESLRLMNKAGVKHDEISAVAVSIAGFVNAKLGLSENSFGIVENNTNIKKLVEEIFDVPVFVDNNVRALSQADLHMRSSSEASNDLFLKHSPGIGGALIINGKPYESANNRSGEIGHVQVYRDGDQCVCGKRGCLSTLVSRSCLINSAKSVFGSSRTPKLWELCDGEIDRITLGAIVESAKQGERLTTEILTEAAQHIALVVNNIMEVFDGDSIRTYGELLNNSWFNELLDKSIDEASNGQRKYKLVKSVVNEREPWQGAVVMAAKGCLKAISEEIAERRKI